MKRLTFLFLTVCLISPLAIGRPGLKRIEKLTFEVQCPNELSGQIKEAITSEVKKRLEGESLLFIPEPNVMYKLPPMPNLVVTVEMTGDSEAKFFHCRVETFLSRRVRLAVGRTPSFNARVWHSPVAMFDSNELNLDQMFTTSAIGQVEQFINQLKAVASADETADTPRRWPGNAVSPPVVGSKYTASKNSKVFHRPDCSSVVRIAPKNIVTYESKGQAVKAGKRPCKICKP